MKSIFKGKHKHLILFVLSFLGFCLVLFVLAWRKSSEKYNDSVMPKFFNNVYRKWAKHFAEINYGLDRFRVFKDGKIYLHQSGHRNGNSRRN